MPRRTRRARLRHRTRSDANADGSNADWNVNETSYADNGDVTVNLSPVDEDTANMMDRRGYNADWMATGRGRLSIEDGDRLVDIVDGSDSLVLEVVKALRHGRRTVLYLEEIGIVQP